ncbi:MAG: hypothetical protein GXP14_14785 [Gammaproteobacteria bacterium]|nr:hypothetical protein [Gammaproteobacteria bacterium]
MTNKSLPTQVLICAYFLLTSTTSYACDAIDLSTLDREKIQLLSLNSENEHTTLYNFRTGHCAPLKQTYNELEVGAFMPSDEASLGMYQIYRNKGENQIDALTHTLEFIIDEQQS